MHPVIFLMEYCRGYLTFLFWYSLDHHKKRNMKTFLMAYYVMIVMASDENSVPGFQEISADHRKWLL